MKSDGGGGWQNKRSLKWVGWKTFQNIEDFVEFLEFLIECLLFSRPFLETSWNFQKNSTRNSHSANHKWNSS